MRKGTRAGIGYDAHRFVEGRPLIIGGVKLPYWKGLEGHSDADVLSHAIGDAILGAMSLGDIGKHFPDTDPAFKGISSLELLKRISSIISKNGGEITNVDSTVVLEEPRLSPYTTQMRKKIADALAVPEDAVCVKATTTEGLGATGRKEGIAAYAIAVVEVSGSPT
ncbi:MAG: 2-C-methyl-D-erythritol 2,4-cyclodiphosphate synthase [Candidatus Eisenbacteria bacterium]|nr:2-C-methyl-D-erythritol 2,4-cyclodiphosphate synthase [Candidatus Eisenbacteria bacterium]